MALKIDNVSKTYGPNAVLSQLSLEIAPSELVVLLGHSGAGKTTLLRIITGLEQCDSGEIFLFGQTITKEPAHRRNIAMLFQRPALFPHLTVQQNLLFPLKRLRLSKKESMQKIAEIAELLGINPFLSRYPETLSGGEQQRVGLGRVLLRDPQLLLLDEPFAHLDFPLQYSLREEIRQLKRRLPIPILYVTHDQMEAMSLGDRLGILHSGQLAQIDCPHVLYNHPQSLEVAQFLGNPPINTINGYIRQKTFIAEGLPAIPIDNAASENAILTIRPEDIFLSKEGISAIVETVEFRGAETIAHLRTGKHLLRCRRTDKIILKPGENVFITLDWKQATIFCKE